MNKLSELTTDCITNKRKTQSMKGSSSPTIPGLFAILENFYGNAQSSKKKIMGLSESGRFPPQVSNPLRKKFL